jgi:hypothetical protein
VTEAEWLTCDDPRRMLEALRGRASDRKARLFACACCRRIWKRLKDARLREAVVAAELFADGLIGVRDLADAGRPVMLLMAQTGQATAAAVAAASKPPEVLGGGNGWYDAHGWYDVRRTAEVVADLFSGSRPPPLAGQAKPGGWGAERQAQAGLLRDLFGGSFRPVTTDPSWLTSTVIAMARAIYDTRDFSAMSILADALQDAGCDSEDILNHCRSPGPHVRGCWVVDLVLGKK